MLKYLLLYNADQYQPAWITATVIGFPRVVAVYRRDSERRAIIEAWENEYPLDCMVAERLPSPSLGEGYSVAELRVLAKEVERYRAKVRADD